MELQPILHVWINHDNDLVDLTVASTVPGKKGQADQQTTEVIHTNQKHPFLTQEAGFVPVADLNVGMHLVEADGNVGVITGWTVVPGAMTMYNLEVAQDHTFTVGDGQWVVHNDSPYAGVRSLINQDSGLIRAAQDAGKNPQIQRDMDHMIEQLMKGGDPGMEQRNLFKGISYARSKGGQDFFIG